MPVMRSDIQEVFPAAGAFVMGGFRHDGGEVVGIEDEAPAKLAFLGV
jgi:hypothetical protein